jgi:hypothetical protein
MLMFVRVAVNSVLGTYADIGQLKIRFDEQQRKDNIADAARQPNRDKQYRKDSSHYGKRNITLCVHQDMRR